METPPPRRSMRRAAEKAIQKIQKVLAWEECPESSAQFQEVAQALDEEFGREILCAEEVVQIEDDPESPEGALNSEEEEEEDSASECEDFIEMDLEDYNVDEDWHPRKRRATWAIMYGGDSLSDLEDDTVETGEVKTEEVAEPTSHLEQQTSEIEERQEGGCVRATVS